MKTIYAANSMVVFLIILGVFAAVAIIAFIIYRVLHPKLKEDPNKPKNEDIVKEEIKRVLVDVDDEEAAKAISEYKEKDE